MLGLRTHLSLLDRFAGEIASGAARIPRQTAARARNYINDAARRTKAEFRERTARLSGKREERNILHANESCAGCKAETARGWVGIGELIPVGQREPCRRFCRCSVDYR